MYAPAIVLTAVAGGGVQWSVTEMEWFKERVEVAAANYRMTLNMKEATPKQSGGGVQ